MATNETLIPIPGRLHSVATEGHVAGANEIYDDSLNKSQETLNAESAYIDTSSQEQAVVPEFDPESQTVHVTAQTLSEQQKAQVRENIGLGDVDAKINEAVASEASQRTAAVSGVQASVNAEATRAQAAEADRYTKSETYTKEEVHNLITTPSQEYVSVTATAQTTAATDVLPATGAADTTYRVGNWDGTQYNDSVFSEYAWNDSTYIKLSTKSQIGEVYDISTNHADTKYADLAAALGINGANIPQNLRKGGMSVKYVQSSDNKYVQARCMAQNFTTDVTKWQGVDEYPAYGSKNLVESGGVEKRINDIASNINLSRIIPNKTVVNDIYVNATGYHAGSNSNINIIDLDEYVIDRVIITTQTSLPSYILFLTSISNIEDGNIPSYVANTGYNRIAPNTTTEYVIPTGCKYIVISGNITGDNYAPKEDTYYKYIKAQEQTDRILEAFLRYGVDFDLHNSRIINYNFESGVWAASFDYRSVLIPVSEIGAIIKLYSISYKCRYAFLKNDTITSGEVPNFAENTDITTIKVGDSSRIEIIPADAEYLCVYVSNGSFYGQFGFKVLDTVKQNVSQRNKEAIQGIQGAKFSFNTIYTDTWSQISNRNSFVLAHLTDIHYDIIRAQNFVDFVNEGKKLINASIVTGDYVTTPSDTQINAIKSILVNNQNVFVNGNHDKAAGNVILSDANIYSKFGLQTNTSELYHYVDYPDNNFRIIILNQYDIEANTVGIASATEHFSQTQIDWFINTLKDAQENNRNVIVAMHSSETDISENNKGFYQRFYQWENLIINVCNGTPISDIIDAFKNGGSINETYSFTDTDTTLSVNTSFAGGGKFVAFVCGHLHGDFIGYSSKYDDQLILSGSVGALINMDGEDYTLNAPDTPRFVDQKNEDCFNVYGFDTLNKIVKVVRVGADMNDLLEERKFAYFAY